MARRSKQEKGIRMSSESMKVLQLRWIESVQKMYDSLDKDVVQFDVKKEFSLFCDIYTFTYIYVLKIKYLALIQF